jgi:membrane-associated phospholipid phosphatase
MIDRPSAFQRLIADPNRIVTRPMVLILGLTVLVEAAGAWATGLRFMFARDVALQVAAPAILAIALRLVGRWPTMGAIADTMLLWTVVAVVGAPLSYLAARAGFPLRDDLFSAADHALGFDGMRWAAAVNAIPWLRHIMHFAYASLGVQVAYCCIMFPLTGEFWRFRELFWLSWLSLLIACAVSAVLPAEGLAARYGVDPEWRAHLLLLRSGHPLTIDVTAMHGVIFFPSFHTALAVTFAWVHRRTGASGMILLALNAVMIVSTLSEGDHYLVDVISGLAMTAGLIWLVDYAGLARDLRKAR